MKHFAKMCWKPKQRNINREKQNIGKDRDIDDNSIHISFQKNSGNRIQQTN